jgi:membrane protein YdbS with pleckstrin-like domain
MDEKQFKELKDLISFTSVAIMMVQTYTLYTITCEPAWMICSAAIAILIIVFAVIGIVRKIMSRKT